LCTLSHNLTSVILDISQLANGTSRSQMTHSRQIPSPPKRVSIVGLGAMGRAIAANLLAGGYDVLVWNRSGGPVSDLVHRGATALTEVSQAFSADLVLSTLFDDAAVRAVFLDHDVGHGAAPGVVHACMSTISPTLSRELAAAHAAHEISYVAAPMFGRPEAAIAASLNIVTGGDAAILDRIEPVLGVLGKCWRVGGDPVHAHLAKIAGNFMIACALETMAEAAALLQAYGADPSMFLSIMANSLFAAPIYKLYGPAVAGGLPATRSGLSLPIKDNALALDAALSGAISLPLAEQVRANLMKASADGFKDEDWSTALAHVARTRGPGRASTLTK
jgi:3-hydroxyisobutyrate dehydrogenase-like beta-hydroxyacid dehydrogenase